MSSISVRLAAKHRPVKPRRSLAALSLAALGMVLQAPAVNAQQAEAGALEWFSKGLVSFRRQKVDESSAYFLEAVQRDPANAEYQLYLAVSYHQAGRFADAERAYARSLTLGGDPGMVRLRRGNMRWGMGDTEGARLDYSAVIEGGGPSVPSALLNRANMQLNLGLHESVIEDYGRYLAMVPNAPDRDVIERILALLNAEIEAQRSAEAARLAEEARKMEEERRRRALMAEVLDSLKQVGDDITSISAGSENIREEFEVSDLED